MFFVDQLLKIHAYDYSTDIDISGSHNTGPDDSKPLIGYCSLAAVKIGDCFGIVVGYGNVEILLWKLNNINLQLQQITRTPFDLMGNSLAMIPVRLGVIWPSEKMNSHGDIPSPNLLMWSQYGHLLVGSFDLPVFYSLHIDHVTKVIQTNLLTAQSTSQVNYLEPIQKQEIQMTVNQPRPLFCVRSQLNPPRSNQKPLLSTNQSRDNHTLLKQP